MENFIYGWIRVWGNALRWWEGERFHHLDLTSVVPQCYSPWFVWECYCQILEPTEGESEELHRQYCLKMYAKFWENQRNEHLN